MENRRELLPSASSSSFRKYVDLFEGKEHEKAEPVGSGSSETVRCVDTVDNDWFIVLPTDSIMSVGTSTAVEPSQQLTKGVSSTLSEGDDPSGEVRRGEQRRQKSFENAERLCGYLNKYKVGGRGMTRLFKRRWFVHADNTCKLLYYRTPSDQIPLGEIDVAHATFLFDSRGDMKSNVFEIRSPEKAYLLQADDRHTMHYWMQELQMRRKLFHRQKRHSVLVQTGEGLLKCSTDSDDDLESQEQSGLAIVDNITAPNTVGITAATTGRRRNIRDLSVVNWKTEIRNVIAGMKGNQLRDPGGTSPSSEETSLANDVDKSAGMLRKVSNFGVTDLWKNFIRQRRAASDCGEISANSSCASCRKLEELMRSTQMELFTVNEELNATHELVKVLQKQIDKLQLNLDTQETLAGSSTEESLREILRQKDTYIVELEHYITSLQQTIAEKDNKNELLEGELESVREDILLYEENLHVKDGIVKSLTSRLNDLEPSGRPTASSTPQPSRRQSELERLKDQCHAFKTQNAFLNQEIMELNQMFRDEEVRSDQLKAQLAELEARYLQLKSKHLYCLKEMSKPQAGVEDQYNMEEVARLLQDALHEEKSMDSTRTSIGILCDQYDQYGFEQSSQNINVDDVRSWAECLRVKSEQLLNTKGDLDVSRAVQWEKILISAKDQRFQNNDELKAMIREGVSPQFRGTVWKGCVDMHVKHLRSCCGPTYYKNLIDRSKSSECITPAVHQIQLDLLRTLPNNQHYSHDEADGIPCLRNVLLAFSLHNPDIGYCQGMNRLAAILLLFLNEEDAFWGLIAIIETLLPRQYYDRTLIAAHADQRVLKDIVAEKLPQLFTHLTSFQCDLSMFTFNWFLVLYVDNLPVEAYLRIWDSFLYEGSKVLFRYAVAILKYCEGEMLSKTNSTELNNYMRNIGDRLTNFNRVSQIAFNDLNPFPMKSIEVKRQAHLHKLRIELSELEALRNSFERSLSLSLNDYGGMLSEEEN